MTQSNFPSPDGYRYGVMFQDGSVIHHWNGQTQRTRAEWFLQYWQEVCPGDHITLARRRPGGLWERVE